MQYFQIVYFPWFKQVAQNMDLKHPQSVFFMFGKGTHPPPLSQETTDTIMRFDTYSLIFRFSGRMWTLNIE